MRLDHVIWATRDLERTALRLRERRGLGSLAGGRHLGMGTENRIVPLGSGYLELLAVVDQEEAAASTFGAWAVETLAFREEGWMGWSVVVDDVQPEAARLGIETGTLERGGLVVDHAGMQQARVRRSLPFFLARRPGVSDPAEAVCVHDAQPRGPIRVELREDASELDRWLSAGGSRDFDDVVDLRDGQPRAFLAASIAVERPGGVEQIPLAPG